MKCFRAALAPRMSCALLASSLLFAGCLDLGNDSGDAGTGGSNGSGTVLSSACAASTFVPCGGDVTGTWDVTSICAEANIVDAVNANIDTPSRPDCSNVCSAASATATGAVKYSAQTVTSGLVFRVVESLSFNPQCFEEARGTSLTDSTCQSFLGDNAGNSTCAVVLSSCNCQYDYTTPDNATTYSLSGNQIIEYDMQAVTQQNFDYCVSETLAGTTMTQQRNMTPGINYLIQLVLRK